MLKDFLIDSSSAPKGRSLLEKLQEGPMPMEDMEPIVEVPHVYRRMAQAVRVAMLTGDDDALARLLYSLKDMA